MAYAETLPTLMKAVVINGPGGREQLALSESVAVPKLSDGHVLVKNTYAGFNFMDIYLRKGLYPSSGGFPLILGQEGAGIIVAAHGPNPLGFRPGDRVVWIGGSGYAEYTALHQGQVIRIPDAVSDEDAVASHLIGMTALSLVEEAYAAKRGDIILVHAAAGGVGTLLCQLLKSEGVTVIATVGGPEKCALAKESGAAHVIDYRDTLGPGWVEEVLKLTDGKGTNAVYDSVGKDTWEGSIEVTKRNGKVVFYGSTSGPVPPLNLGLIRAKNLSVMQPTLPNFLATRQELEHYANGVLDRVKDGRLKVKTSRIYSLGGAAQAHQDMEERKSTGKLLLKL